MEPSPPEVKWSSDSHEIPHILWKLKVHYCIHNSPTPVSTINQVNPVHGPSNSLNTHFNIILPSTPRSSKWSLSLKFPHQTPHSCYILCLFHSSRLKILSLCRLLQSHVISSFFDPNIFLSTLFSYTLSLCSFLNIRNRVSHP